MWNAPRDQQTLSVTNEPAQLANPVSALAETRLAASLTAIGLIITLAFALSSPEGIHQFDDLTHYLFANWAWKWPTYLLDDWGRPGFTALYFLPARPGWTACRILSVLLTAASAWLAFRSARQIGLRHAWAVIPLCYAQPLFFQLAQTTLTETTLAFYLTFAVYLALLDRWSWSAAFVSLAVITRHEAVIFLPIWLYFARRERTAHRWCENPFSHPPSRESLSASNLAPAPQLNNSSRRPVQLWRLWPLIWAPLVINILAIPAQMKPAVVRLFEPHPAGWYGAGGWLTFFSRSMEAWGPAIMVLAMTGIATLWRKRGGGALIAACAVIYFVAHAVIRALGLFDSGGYARFLVPISPLIAIAALTGWLRLWSADPGERRAAIMLAAGSMILLWISMERQLVLYAARLDLAAELPEIHTAKVAIRITTAVLAVLAIIVAGFGAWQTGTASGLRLLSTQHSALSTRHAALSTAFLQRALIPAALTIVIILTCSKLCHPLERPPAAYIIDDLQRWLADHGLGTRKILTADIWVTYATRDELPHGRPPLREALKQAPAGTLFAWDDQFAASPDHGISLHDMLSNPAFHLIHATKPLPFQQRPYLLIFEKR